MWWTLHSFFRFESQIWIPPTSKSSSKYANQKRCTHWVHWYSEICGGYAPFHKRFLSFWLVNPCFPALKEVALTYVGPFHPPDYISWAYSLYQKKIEVSSIKNFRSKMIWYDMQKMDIHLENPQLVTMSQPSSIWRTQPWKSKKKTSWDRTFLTKSVKFCPVVKTMCFFSVCSPGI